MRSAVKFRSRSSAWSPVMEKLPTSYRCVALDARGSGDSDAPATGYSAVDWANDEVAAIEVLGITNYILVGHSMGGTDRPDAQTTRIDLNAPDCLRIGAQWLVLRWPEVGPSDD
jgi:pimeloyl-ACP methyl ester carboxylesterase